MSAFWLKWKFLGFVLWHRSPRLELLAFVCLGHLEFRLVVRRKPSAITLVCWTSSPARPTTLFVALSPQPEAAAGAVAVAQMGPLPADDSLRSFWYARLISDDSQRFLLQFLPGPGRDRDVCYTRGTSSKREGPGGMGVQPVSTFFSPAATPNWAADSGFLVSGSQSQSPPASGQ